jgi:hypothetical protein
MNEQRAKRDLALIRRMMEDGRREVVDRGKHFLVWGVIGTVGAAVTYAHAVGWTAFSPGWLWLGLLVVGWTLSVVVGRRESQRARIQSLASRLLAAVWISSAIAITLLALGGMFGGGLYVRSLPGLLSVVLGAPVVVTGVLSGEAWLRAVGVGWWIGGALMLFVPGLYTLLVMAGMSLVLLAIPGGVLFARSRRDPAAPVAEAP